MLDLLPAFGTCSQINLQALLSGSSFVGVSNPGYVTWSNNRSETFDISNGVKQDGVISALLFSICIDNLFLELRTSCPFNIFSFEKMLITCKK